jgi:hypothetical protein
VSVVPVEVSVELSDVNVAMSGGPSGMGVDEMASEEVAALEVSLGASLGDAAVVVSFVVSEKSPVASCANARGKSHWMNEVGDEELLSGVEVGVEFGPEIEVEVGVEAGVEVGTPPTCQTSVKPTL